MKENAIEYSDAWYYTPEEWEIKGGLWPVRSGRNIAKPNYRVGPKSIACHSLHFVVEGRLELSFAERHIELAAGDCFCLFPDTTYNYRALSAEPALRKIWLALDGPQTADLMRLAGLTPDAPFRRQVPDLFPTLQELLALFEDGHTSGHTMLQSLIYKLFARLQPAAVRRPAAASPAVWLEQSVAYMNIHLAENIGVTDVAAHIGLHRSYFSKTFTEHMHISPVRYLQRLKMDKAAHMLADPGRTVTEIALSLGYPDLFSFTRAFKRHFGSPPSEYRRRQPVR